MSILLILVISVITVTGNDYVSSNSGYEFCFGFSRSPSNDQYGYLVVSSSSHSDVDFTLEYGQSSIFNRQTNKMKPYKGQISSIYSDVKDSSYQYRNLGVCITSESLISVSTFLLYFGRATSSYLALPYQEILADYYEYYTLSTNSSNSGYKSGFLLVSYRDSTFITIYPSIPLNIIMDTQDQSSTDIEILPGGNHTVILHRRQTLYIGKGDGADVTGTRIVSDKPLTVISGHEAGSVPSDGTLEPIALLIPPTQLWGVRFMVAPFNESSLGSIVKIVAANNFTRVQCECGGESSVLNITANGGFKQLFVPANVYCYIEADNPVLVGLFRYSTADIETGDTVMVLVPSIDQYSNNILFSTHNDTTKKNTNDLMIHFISIVVPKEYFKANEMYYDDILIDATWSPIYYNQQIKGYGCSFQINPVAQSHFVNGADEETYFFVMVYGFRTGRSYGYLAGLIIPTARILGFEWPSELYSVTEFEGLLNFNIPATRSISQNVTFSYSTMPIYGVSLGADYTSVEEELIVYKAYSHGFSFSIEIHDDDLTEEEEALSILVCSQLLANTKLCFSGLIVIVDNDVLTIGITTVMYIFNSHILSVDIAVMSGQLEQQYKVDLKLNITLVSQDELSVNTLEFTNHVKTYSIEFTIPDVKNGTKVTAVLSAVDSTQTLLLLLDPKIKDVPILNVNTWTTPTTSIGTIPTTNIWTKTTTNTGTKTTTNTGTKVVTNTGATNTETKAATNTDSIISPTPSNNDESSLTTNSTNYTQLIALPLIACVILIIAIIVTGSSTALYCIWKRKRKERASFLQQSQLQIAESTLSERVSSKPLLVLVNPRQNELQDRRDTRGRQYRSVPLVHEVALPTYTECQQQGSDTEERERESSNTVTDKEEEEEEEEVTTRFDAESEEEFDKESESSAESNGYESTTSH